MIFSVEKETAVRLGVDVKKLGGKVATAVLEAEDFPFLTKEKTPAAEVSLLLTDDEGIQRLNKTYRKKNRPTDVLSFPSTSFSGGADFDALREDAALYDGESKHYFLGDIVLNAEAVLRQAAAYGHSVRRETAFLIAHSVLHLIGYDHETKEEAAVMEEKQEAALQQLKIPRGHVR